MHPAAIAERAPDRPAVIMAGSGEVMTFRELDERSNRLAHLFRSRGVGQGGRIAILLENQIRYLEVVWAAQRSGLAYTTVNTHLTADEAAYIIDDCGASVVVSSAAMAPLATAFAPDAIPNVHSRLMVDGTAGGWESYEDAVAGQPATPIDDEAEGDFVLYSSGTTGRPKGIQRELTLAPLGHGIPSATPFLQMMGLGDGDVYLCPAPLYHAAPVAWSSSAHRLGGTSVIMEHFDPALALETIERYRVTHAQFVPTMFVRMLRLPEPVRTGADVSSLRRVVHAAAPCPVPVKHQMLDWWGPIIDELYSSTEGVGVTFITADDWLAHPGSVGKPLMGTPHVLDDDGNELPVGEIGTIWFEGVGTYEYRNDPDKTRSAGNERGWRTVGDMGRVDEEGYLYLADRRVNLILSGGVNIYPQEIEDVLITHPKVEDVAVFGVPDEEFGQEVKAVVQPRDGVAPGPELEAELIDFCREHLAHYKCPRSVDFDPALPRLDSGKLYKRLVRDRYWP